ncbi:MAG: hypothetical protein GY869_05660, partial [Planctomycetes bacterium]|nr:hypothetical protein [Planctomycetota bacterium]
RTVFDDGNQVGTEEGGSDWYQAENGARVDFFYGETDYTLYTNSDGSYSVVDFNIDGTVSISSYNNWGELTGQKRIHDSEFDPDKLWNWDGGVPHGVNNGLITGGEGDDIVIGSTGNDAFDTVLEDRQKKLLESDPFFGPVQDFFGDVGDAAKANGGRIGGVIGRTLANELLNTYGIDNPVMGLVARSAGEEIGGFLGVALVSDADFDLGAGFDSIFSSFASKLNIYGASSAAVGFLLPMATKPVTNVLDDFIEFDNRILEDVSDILINTAVSTGAQQLVSNIIVNVAPDSAVSLA